MSQKSSCGNAVPTQFLMWERRSHAFPPHYTTASSTDKYVLKYKYQVQVLYLTPTLARSEIS